ncbi:MAG: hypothetical protein JW809_09230 [Pirellulales bacterium]|nr:hypothetical protein [Pirellulales bacterium]
MATLAAFVLTSWAAEWKPVTERTKLKRGDKVQVQRLGQWVDGVVVGVNQSGWIGVRFRDEHFGGREMTLTLPRDHFRIPAAPRRPRNLVPANENPFEPAKKTRTWSDNTGKFKIEAELVEVLEDAIRLKRPDGQEMTVPRARLSREDREYLRSLQQADDEDDDRFGQDDEEDDSGFPMKDADVSGATVVMLAQAPKPENLAPDAVAPPKEPNARPVALPAKGDFFEQMEGLLVAASDPKRAVLVFENRHHNYTRHVLATLAPGSRASAALEGADGMKAIDLSPAGDLLLTVPAGRFHDRTSRVDVWRIAGTKLEHVVGWQPYAAGTRGFRGVEWGAFVDADHVLTGDLQGRLVLWKLPEVKAVYTCEGRFNMAPALSAGRKYLAVSTAEGVAVLDAKSGETLGGYRGPNAWGTLSFRPDGKQIALVSANRLTVWDFSTGELYRDIGLSVGPWHGGGIAWPSPGYLLVGNKYLIDLEHYVPLWEYRPAPGAHGGAMAFDIGGQFWYLLPGTGGQALLPLSLPHDEAKQVAAQLDASKLLAVRPGMTVTLEVNVSAQPNEIQQVTDHLTRLLTANGLKVAPGQPVKLVAQTRPGEATDETYGPFGPFSRRQKQTVQFQEHVSEVAFVVADKKAWSVSSLTQAPHSLHLQEGETLEQALAKYAQPNVQFFQKVNLPQCIAWPREQDVYGATEISPQGLHPAAVRPKAPKTPQPPGSDLRT